MSISSDPAKTQPLLESVLHAAQHGVLITDATQPDSPIVYCNPAAEKITGYPAGEMLGKNCRFLQGPDTAPGDLDQLRQAMREGRECRLVLKNYRKDGSTFWNEVAISPVRDAQGRLTHYVGVLSDITDREQARGQLAAAHERLKTAYAREQRIAETLQENDLQLADILESITDGFFALDGQWRFRYLNQQSEPLLGQTRQDLLGQTLWEAFPATVGTAFEQEFHRAVSERTALEFTEFYEPRQAWWDIRVYPTPEGLTVFLRDVTEHHRAEEERRQMQARQRAFLRDVLGSVTEGKLRLCETPDELPPMLTPVGEPVALSRTEGLDTLRHLADEAAVAVGLSEEKRFDLAISVGEAAMNAVVHAGTGTGRVSTSESGTVQVRVEDQGRGIAVENLPKATLERGYTTAGTMGHGMKIMLQALDRLWLLTSPAGTIVVMERDRAEQEPDWLQTVATNSPA